MVESSPAFPPAQPPFVEAARVIGEHEPGLGNKVQQVELGKLAWPETALHSPSTAEESTSSSQSAQPAGVSWQWEHRNGFRDYKPEQNAAIELAFQRGDAKVRLKTGKTDSTPMEVFFHEMIQYDSMSGNIRKVRRTGSINVCMRMRRFVMELLRALETGQPRRQTLSQYLSLRRSIDTACEHRREPDHDDADHEREPENGTKPGRETNRCVKLARSSAFLCCSMTAVFLNILWIGLEVEFNPHANLSDADPVFRVVEHIFCVLFLVEAVIRFCAFQRKCDCLKDAWFCWDSALVVLMIAETWLLPLILLMAGGGGEKAMFRNVTVLRLARIVRISRMSRLLRELPELMTLLKGILRALRSVLFTLLMELFLLYFFSIIFCTWVRGQDNAELDEYFSSLALSFSTLLLHGIFLDGPSVPLNATRGPSPFLTVMFLCFIIMSSFTVLNMLIGILCQVIVEVSDAEKTKKEAIYLRDSLLEIMKCYDGDDDGTIGKDEFRILMKNPEVHDVLRRFGTDVHDLVMLTDVFFEDMTQESEKGQLSFEEILQVVLRLRGQRQAHVTDIVEMREYLRQSIESVRNQLCAGQRNVIDDMVRRLQVEHLAIAERLGPCASVARRLGHVRLHLALDGQSEVQLRAATTTIADVLQEALCQAAPGHGRLAAVDASGLEMGPELTLGDVADAQTGEVSLELVLDTWPASWGNGSGSGSTCMGHDGCSMHLEKGSMPLCTAGARADCPRGGLPVWSANAGRQAGCHC
uniref:EF-hand domain-containing protein n=1 Tax=Pyrodinium bahamense TaxID=73915 RepID=A0A7S0F905_9DINO|mmetsp:Transcript_12441/g.34284  ORF Transcript_12441/g.34284 Transcript_12441/m.34284 type:complete len:755 (+) Transcript_12441:72-2336(+)